MSRQTVETGNLTEPFINHLAAMNDVSKRTLQVRAEKLSPLLKSEDTDEQLPIPVRALLAYCVARELRAKLMPSRQSRCLKV